MQLRDQFNDLIFDGDDIDTAGAVAIKNSLQQYPLPSPAIADVNTIGRLPVLTDVPVVRTARPEEMSQPITPVACDKPWDPDQARYGRVAARYINRKTDCAHSPLPDNDRDMAWLDDMFIIGLIGQLHPKDPPDGRGPGVTLPGNMFPSWLKSAGDWDALTRSADAVAYPVFAIDNTRKVIAWNTAMETLTGIPRRDMIGKGDHAYAVPFFGSPRPMLIDQIIIPPSIAKLLEPIPATRDGEAFIGELEEAEINGKAVLIWGKAARIYDEQGMITAAVQSIGISGRPQSPEYVPDESLWRKQGDLHSAFDKLSATQEELLRNYRDLTQTQAQLIESERKVRTQEAFLNCVISDAREGFVAFDRDLRYILWNRFMEELTGQSSEEVLGKDAAGMFPIFAVDGGNHLLERALAGETVESPDFSFLIPHTGKQAWVRVIYSPLSDSNGTSVGVIGIVQDTTARKVMEYALETTIVQLMESESKYRNVFNAKHDPLVLINAVTRVILDLNEAASSLYGWSREEMLKMSLSDIAAELEKTGETASSGFPEVRTGRHRKKDGSVFPVDISSSYFDLKGNPVLILSIRDLSSFQQVADALRLANARLNLMIGITRHDVLNNLTAVMGYNTLLRKDISDTGAIGMLDKQEKALNAIRSQIEFTKEYDNLGLKTPVWQNVATVAFRAYSRFVNTISFTCDTRELEIYADPMFEKVFYNLFDNAFRYGENMSRITVSYGRQENDLLLFFEDDGPGIPPGDKAKIFTRGFGKNTGLGLFLTREILAITHIGIKETGEYRKGARFEFRFPEGSYRFARSAVPGSPKVQDEMSLPVFFGKMMGSLGRD